MYLTRLRAARGVDWSVAAICSIRVGDVRASNAVVLLDRLGLSHTLSKPSSHSFGSAVVDGEIVEGQGLIAQFHYRRFTYSVRRSNVIISVREETAAEWLGAHGSAGCVALDRHSRGNVTRSWESCDS